MKSRKVLPHSELVSEVTAQVMKLFQPQISTIKKVIEYLIENDYIERETDEEGRTKKVYHYLA